MKNFPGSLLVAALMMASPALRAQIIWDTPVSGLGDASSVATNGTYFDALSTHIGGTQTDVLNPTTNVTTTFNAFEPGTLTDGTITIGNAGGYGGDGSGSSSTAYDSVLNGCSFVQNGIGTITIGGLTASDQYQVQIWNVDNDPTRETSFTDGTATSFYNGYVIGTFTAGSSTETIDFTNVVPDTGSLFTAGEVNAVDVRLVPEPTIYALLVLGLGAAVAVRFVSRRSGLSVA